MKARVAEKRDIVALRELEIQAYGYTWEAEAFEREFRRRDCLYTVVDSEACSSLTPRGGLKPGPLAAVVSLNWIADEVHLLSIAVAPVFQRQGLARSLLGTHLAFSQQMALNWMTLEVKWENTPALTLYRHYGFTTTGRRKKYYRDGQDARIMWSSSLQEEGYKEQLAAYQEDAQTLRQEWEANFQDEDMACH